MIIFSVKMNKGRLFAGAGVLLVLTILVVFFCGAKRDRFVGGSKKIVVKGYTATNNDERRDFFTQFGWELSEEPMSVSEVVIPEDFDEAMQNYNAIQKKQGLDLSKFRGRRAQHYTYKITNYPNREDVVASLLLVDNKLVGGDISATGKDSFMHGFALEQ